MDDVDNSSSSSAAAAATKLLQQQQEEEPHSYKSQKNPSSWFHRLFPGIGKKKISASGGGGNNNGNYPPIRIVSVHGGGLPLRVQQQQQQEQEETLVGVGGKEEEEESATTAVWKSYGARYWLLTSVVLLNLANYSHWVSFPSVTKISAQYYDQSGESMDLIPTLSYSLGIPFCMIATFAVEKCGLKWCLRFGGTLTGIGNN